MNINLSNIDPLVAILCGVLILVFPKFLNYFIAAYLIIVGILGLGIIQ